MTDKKDLILRLPEDIDAALQAEAKEMQLSSNTLLVVVLAERYHLPFNSKGTRAPGLFKRGELNQPILQLLTENEQLSTVEIQDRLLAERQISSDKLESARYSIANVLSGMAKRKLIIKCGKIGYSNVWTIKAT